MTLIISGNIPGPEILKMGEIIGFKNLPRISISPNSITKLDSIKKGSNEGNSILNQISSPSLALFIANTGLIRIFNIIIEVKTIKLLFINLFLFLMFFFKLIPPYNHIFLWENYERNIKR